jgi:hypothetical protein
MPRSFENQRLSGPVVLRDLLTGQTVATLQGSYYLTEVEFLHLRGRPSLAAIWATNMFFIVVGYAWGLRRVSTTLRHLAREFTDVSPLSGRPPDAAC